ncbi:MAG TPA: MerR family transcriptional regulator [Actinomycetales bacterium]|nr:MerR family transcriptional regulator [Actinomycetales bacterium]
MSKDAPAPLPALTVSAVAARLGVAPATLRTWDRRYSLGPSSHTAGSHRRYTGADIARLMIMRRLTLEGVAPSEAARIALATAVDSQMSQSFLADDGTYLPAVPISAHASGAVPKGQARPVDILGDGVTAGFTPSQLASRAYDKDIREALLSAATGFDEVGAIRLVQAVSDARGIADTWTQVVKGTVIELMGSSDLVDPGMDPLSVVKTAVMITLRRAARQKADGSTSDQCIMVTAAPDEVSTLGAHVLSAALNQSDASSAVLLGRLEVPVVRDTIKNTNPAVIVVVSWTEPSTDMDTAVDYCLETAADVPLILTGPSWPTETPAGAHRVRTFIGALHEAQAYVS